MRRCLTLAEELHATLGSRETIGFLIEGGPESRGLVARAGFDAVTVAGPEPAATLAAIGDRGVEVLVADSYEIRAEAFSAWRRSLRALVVVDDLADRQLDVDMVVNGSVRANELAYSTAPGCVLLLGPQYALLRRRFRNLPPHRIGPGISRVLLTLGGADPLGLTPEVALAVSRALPHATVDVVIGPLFGREIGFESVLGVEDGRIRAHRNVEDLAPLMEVADLSVSGGGQTLFELAAVGVPTIAVCLASNQEANIAALDGVTLLAAGRSPEALPLIERLCRQLDGDLSARRRLSSAGQATIDGQGAARVVTAMLQGPLGR